MPNPLFHYSGLPADLRENARADDAQQSTIGTRLGQFCYILICLHALFFGYIAIAHRPVYDFLKRQEGAVEFLTFVVFLLACVALSAAVLATRRLFLRCVYVLGGIALLFFAGEEISWGQHIIGYATPDFMVDLNYQREFNIHNVKAFYDVVGNSEQRSALFMLCLVACAAFFARKNRIFGIPSPPIPITLALLVAVSYFSTAPIFIFDGLDLYGYRGLFLLLLIVALLSGNARLFIATAASLSISLFADYLSHHYLSHHSSYIDFHELSEYLFSVCCFFYALHALLDQRAARQKIASAVAALKSAAALPSIRIKSPTPPYGRGQTLRRISNVSWTSICALVIAGNIGLALIGYFHYRADVAAFQETRLLIQTISPAARSNFDVYIDRRDLHYFKQPCDYADVESTLFLGDFPLFFLGVFPQNVDDLPVGRRQHGFENLDFRFRRYGWTLDGACAAKVRLPGYEIASVSTGQYTWDENGVVTNLWKSEFPYRSADDHRAYAAALEETRSLTRTMEPAARSNFDVYIDGRDLHYFKQPCVHPDLTSTFFLGVFPQNVDDLPVGQRQNGFENLDFEFGQYGQMIDSACAATVRLPDYEIAHISTGQYTWDADGVATNIWVAEFPVNK